MRHDDIRRWAWGAVLGLLAGAWGCAPRASQGGCDDDLECARGEFCDLEANECMDAGLDVTSTENPAPGTFQNKVISFHRGQVCVPMEVESGERFPVLMQPCLHPCVSVSSYEFRHIFECLGSRCDALGLMWMTASSAAAGCPADAFGSFDPGMCTYDTEVEFAIATETSNGPISGTMRLEIPFLSNADAETIAADPDDDATIEALVHQYPDDENRVPDGRDIQIRSNLPTPPESCAGGACDCFPIGF